MTIDLDTLTLSRGKHTTPEQGMCLIEAAAYIAGEPFTDHPQCVSPLLAETGRQLNDLLPDEELKKLNPLIPHLVGTRNDGLDQQRSALAWAWIVTVFTPAWLRLAGLNSQATALETADPNDAPLLLEAAQVATLEAAQDAAREAVQDTDQAAMWYPAWDAAQAALWYTARYTARYTAVDAASYAAVDVASYVAWDAASCVNWDALQPTADTLRASFTELYCSMVMLGKTVTP